MQPVLFYCAQPPGYGVDMMFIRVSRVNVLIWYFALVQEGAPFKAQ